MQKTAPFVMRLRSPLLASTLAIVVAACGSDATTTNSARPVGSDKASLTPVTKPSAAAEPPTCAARVAALTGRLAQLERGGARTPVSVELAEADGKPALDVPLIEATPSQIRFDGQPTTDLAKAVATKLESLKALGTTSEKRLKVNLAIDRSNENPMEIVAQVVALDVDASLVMKAKGSVVEPRPSWFVGDGASADLGLVDQWTLKTLKAEIAPCKSLDTELSPLFGDSVDWGQRATAFRTTVPLGLEKCDCKVDLPRVSDAVAFIVGGGVPLVAKALVVKMGAPKKISVKGSSVAALYAALPSEPEPVELVK